MAKVELSGIYAKVSKMLPEGVTWQYKAVLLSDRVNHTWAVASDKGGIHIHGFRCEYVGFDREWLGGIETHSATPFEYGDQKTPTHEHCWLINCPCWHDGTSLGFSENVAHALPFDSDDIPDAAHLYVTQEALSWYRRQFVENEATTPCPPKATQ